MLCITSNMSKRTSHFHFYTLHLHIVPGLVLMNFLNSNDEVVDLVYSGNVFPRLFYFQTFLYSEYGFIDYAVYECNLASNEIYLS